MAHIIGITETSENLTANEQTVYIECGKELLGYHVFNKRADPSEIHDWCRVVLEGHKKDCTNFDAESCQHNEEHCYEITCDVGIEIHKGYCCVDCVGDYVFLLSARGRLTIERTKQPSRGPVRQNTPEFTGFTVHKDLKTGDLREN